MAGIYKITNKINNKIYIGMTTKDIETRWKQHLKVSKNKNDKNHRLIHKAINKYGVNNFIFEKLYETDIINLEHLKELEIKYIKEYNSFGSGYNLTKGGDGTYGYKLSQERKEYLSQLYLGTKLSDEHKHNITKGLLNRHYKTSDETKLKIKNSRYKKPIILFYLDNAEIIMELEFQSDIEKIYSNVNKKKINKVIKRHQQILGYIGDRIVSCTYKENKNDLLKLINDIKLKYDKKHDTKKTQLLLINIE